jgi:hypothetical protein
MSAKKRMNNLKNAKAARQKKLAIVLGVVFAVVLVVQVPRTLKRLHGSSTPTAAPASSSSQTPGTVAPGSATPGSATALTAASSSTRLPESDLPPRRTKSELVSFERFDSKDPFAPQVSDATVATPGYSGAAPAAAASSPTATATSSSSAIPATTPSQPAQPAAATASTTTAGSSSGGKLGAAVIDVNGQPQAVRISQAFPQGNPTFKLVSVQGRTAMIGIAGGSFASGNQTLALQLGKTLTLMNTSGGQRYELRLVSVR